MPATFSAGGARLFMAGLGLFALCSLLCGLATSSGMLIAFRALQGAAGAILSPSVFSIVTVTFEEGKERNTALGILGGIAGSGAAIGVLLGGVLTEFAGWQWIFFVNVPIGVLTLFLVRRFVRESRSEGIARSFDAGGAFAVTSSLMVLVYALTQASTKGWGSAQTIVLLLVSAALMAAFILIESRVSHPLIPLGFFRRRTPTGANIIGFGLGTMVFGMFFLLSLYMQEVLGFSALKTGVAYLAVALTAVVASGVAQALVTRLGVKPVLTIGMITLTIGLLLFAQISPTGSYFSDLFPGFITVGVGLGFSFVPISIAALAGIEPQEAGLASGLINTSQQIGGALGVAILTTVAISRTNRELAGGASQAVANTAGYQLAFYVAAAFAVASLVATLLIVRRHELEPSPAGAVAYLPLSLFPTVRLRAAKSSRLRVITDVPGHVLQVNGEGEVGAHRGDDVLNASICRCDAARRPVQTSCYLLPTSRNGVRSPGSGAT
ncbi:MAG TPA: MFS transporter, partial [Gaiellaceae bacterium]